MKSLAEHEAERQQAHEKLRSNEPQLNGIACPRCSNELWDSSPMFTLTSNPPQKNVHCTCGYRGYRMV